MIHRGRLLEDFFDRWLRVAPAPTDASTSKSDEGAVYCQDCKRWLNGPTQWEEHKIGKRHRKSHGRYERQQRLVD